MWRSASSDANLSWRCVGSMTVGGADCDFPAHERADFFFSFGFFLFVLIVVISDRLLFLYKRGQ